MTTGAVIAAALMAWWLSVHSMLFSCSWHSSIYLCFTDGSQEEVSQSSETKAEWSPNLCESRLKFFLSIQQNCSFIADLPTNLKCFSVSAVIASRPFA